MAGETVNRMLDGGEALPCHVILKESSNMQVIYLTLKDPYRMTGKVVLLQAGRSRSKGKLDEIRPLLSCNYM